MARTLLLIAALVALTAPVRALPADNATRVNRAGGGLAAGVDVLPVQSRIMVRPPVLLAEEAGSASAPAPLAVRPNAAPAAPAAVRPAPGTISFPNERLQLADDRLDDGQNAAWSWDSLYEGCGVTKNCVGVPEDCEQRRACRAIATVQYVNQETDPSFHFKMRASDAKYVAVGLGFTNEMYETSVIECVDDGTGIRAYLSYTPPKPRRGCERDTSAGAQSAIELVNRQSMDGGIFCEVRRVNHTRVSYLQQKEFFLDRDAFYIQVAHGTILKANGVGFHDGKNRAARATMLADYKVLGSVSNWPMRMHGALMVLAWMFAATVGTLAARYFKAAWGKATICGKAMWFAWHRLLMMATVVLHGVAVVTALIFLNGWSTSSGVHGILGGITTGLALLQGLGGLARPSPDHQYRPVFNWAHRCQGFLTHVLAMVTIFLAVGLGGARLPSYVYFILAAYVVFYVAMHAVHSLTEVKSYYFLVIVFGSAVFAIAMLVLVVVAPGD